MDSRRREYLGSRCPRLIGYGGRVCGFRGVWGAGGCWWGPMAHSEHQLWALRLPIGENWWCVLLQSAASTPRHTPGTAHSMASHRSSRPPWRADGSRIFHAGAAFAEGLDQIPPTASAIFTIADNTTITAATAAASELPSRLSIIRFAADTCLFPRRAGTNCAEHHTSGLRRQRTLQVGFGLMRRRHPMPPIALPTSTRRYLRPIREQGCRSRESLPRLRAGSAPATSWDRDEVKAKDEGRAAGISSGQIGAPHAIVRKTKGAQLPLRALVRKSCGGFDAGERGLAAALTKRKNSATYAYVGCHRAELHIMASFSGIRNRPQRHAPDDAITYMSPLRTRGAREG